MPDPADMDEAQIARELVGRLARDVTAMTDALACGAGHEAIEAASRAHAQENTDFLKALIGVHGWPGAARFGQNAQAAAGWLLAVSAGIDPGFQNSCLDLLEGLLEVAGLDAQFYAFTVDRVLVSQGRVQRYGTQGFERRGCWVLDRVEDPARLDVRRARIGLGPLELEQSGSDHRDRSGARRRPARPSRSRSRP